MSEIIQIFGFVVLIFSIVIHEFSHGWMADRLGDPTARYMGRLTLNPIPHIDPIGSVLLPLFLVLTNSPFIFGWAKPVPYNPYNLKDQKKGPALVALAGPLINLTIAVIFGVLVRVLLVQGALTYALYITLFAFIVHVNLLLGIFNLVPLFPLDGSKILEFVLPRSMQGAIQFMERNFVLFIMLFVIFGFDLIKPVIAFMFAIIVGAPDPFF